MKREEIHRIGYSDAVIWPAQNIWRLAWRAARSGYGVPYFRSHPELMRWLKLARQLHKS